jgi:predicted ATP-grasp superfamily ATP-dependent carboligase
VTSAPTVLVTDADRGSALSIIRSLGRRGWRVIAVGENPASIGFRSRHASECLVVPSPAREPARFVESVFEAATSRRVDLIIPVTDAVILPLHEERGRFRGISRLALPEDADALRAVTDKSRTLELAASLGVPAPRGVLATSAETALRGAESLGWPVVLKPRSSRVLHDREAVESFEVSYAGSPDDLLQSLDRLDGGCGVLVQEYCGGVGRGVGLLMHEGRPLAAFQHRRMHEVPITGGASSLRESEPLDPELYEYSLRLLGALRWTGLAMVEFKAGASGPKLMEVNGRVWGSLPLAVMSGVDFPALLGSLYLTGPPGDGVPPQLTYRAGVRARNLALDVTWILTTLGRKRRFPFLPAPSRGQGVLGLLGLFHPRDRFDVQSLADPGPGLAEIPQIIRHVWRKGLGTLARPSRENCS